MRVALGLLLILVGLLAVAAGMLVLAVHGGTCSPHEGGSGCGFKIGLAIPWVLALGFVSIGVMVLVRATDR